MCRHVWLVRRYLPPAVLGPRPVASSCAYLLHVPYACSVCCLPRHPFFLPLSPPPPPPPPPSPSLPPSPHSVLATSCSSLKVVLRDGLWTSLGILFWMLPLPSSLSPSLPPSPPLSLPPSLPDVIEAAMYVCTFTHSVGLPPRGPKL